MSRRTLPSGSSVLSLFPVVAIGAILAAVTIAVGQLPARGSNNARVWLLIVGVVGIAATASAMIIAVVQRRRQVHSFNASTSGLSEAVLLIRDERVVGWVGAAEHLLATAGTPLIGTAIAEVLPIDDPRWDQLVRRASTAPGTQVEENGFEYLNQQGHIRTLDLTVTDRRSDRAVRAIVVTLHDRTTEVELREQFARQASAHPSTNLPNPSRFRELLSIAVHRARRSGEHLAVLSIHLDNIDTVRQVMSEQQVERLLSEVGTRLRTALRVEDTVGHIGRREFGIVLEGMAAKIGRAYAVDVADRIAKSMTNPVTIDNHHVSVQVSIGIAHRSKGVSDPTAAELIAEAHAAMLEVKANEQRWSDLKTTP